MSTYREQAVLRTCGELYGKWTMEGKVNGRYETK